MKACKCAERVAPYSSAGGKALMQPDSDGPFSQAQWSFLHAQPGGSLSANLDKS